MINWLIFCSFIASLSLTLLGVAVDLTYQIKYRPRVDAYQADLNGKLASYLQEKQLYQQHPLFGPADTNGQDFQNFLVQDLGESEYLLVDGATKKQVLSLGPRWLEKRHKLPINENITRLFEKVQEYQYWELTEDQLNQLEISPSDFSIAGQIYLAHSFENRPEELESFLGKTRHLSRLLLGAEHLNFKRAGLSLLEKEIELTEFLNIRKIATPLKWQTMTRAELKRYRQFLEQTDSYLSLLAPPEALKKVFLEQDTPPGFCAVYNRKSRLLSWGKPFLAARVPFEPSFDDNVKIINQVQLRSQEQCLPQTRGEPTQRHIASHIPYYRRIYALKTLLEATKGSTL